MDTHCDRNPGISRLMGEDRWGGGNFVSAPENRSAQAAVRQLAHGWTDHHNPNSLFVHGPPGSGKSLLLSNLVSEALHETPDLTVTRLTGGDFNALVQPNEDTEAAPLAAARQADLLILEDIHHLAESAAERLVALIDHRGSHEQPMVFTASVGPGQLMHRSARFTARLRSRLAAGLVVGIEPLSVPSRLALVRELAQRRRIALNDDALNCLAQRLTSGRQLDGILAQLEAMARQRSGPLDLATVQRHLEVAHAVRPTVARIADRVGRFFLVDSAQLRSPRRTRNVLWPRQVGMYLARQLTQLSLEQVGAYFGGRDHTTVLHACRKVERSLARNNLAAGAVRQLQAELT